jgi:AraC-like DNA-binding protein
VIPDVLSDALRGVRLRGAVFFNVSGRGDWAAEAAPGREVAPMLMPGLEHVMEYHALARGECWASIPGGPAVRLAAGDVVVFPHGHAHVISSAPGMRGETGVNWLANAHAHERPYQVNFDGRQVELHALPDKPVDTAIVCGFLGCDLQPFNPLITALPPLLHLRASEDDAWIASFTQQAVAESHVRRPGGEAMLARMSEMMFVNAVRRYAERLPESGTSWLAALRDRFVGRTLTLLHADPARDWTLEELGRSVGLSRSALHERFVALVGIAPMQYLAQWRMQAAARLLLESRATVATIALEVGYESEAAFARAFKRLLGKPPATWRRERESRPAA